MLGRCGLPLGLVVVLAGVFFFSGGAEPADRCAAAAYVGETTVPTADVEFYEHDLVLIGPRLEPGPRLTDHGRAYEPRFSPDGQRLVFTSGRGRTGGNSDGPTAIAVIDVSGGAQRDLTADHHDRFPQWSPAGSLIAFLRTGTDGAMDLMVIDPEGGSPRTVRSDAIAWFTWLSDDELVISRYTVGDALEAVRVTVDGEELGPFPLGAPEVASAGYGRPLWSPDRTEYAYVRYPDSYEDPAARPVIRIHDVATGQERIVPGSDTQVNSPLLWTSGGSVMFMKNVRGEAVDVALSANGGRAAEEVIGRLMDNARTGWPQDDNPTCPP